jgi:hypothetical protein
MQKVELTMIIGEKVFQGIWIKGDNHSTVYYKIGTEKVFRVKKNWTYSDLQYFPYITIILRYFPNYFGRF